MARKVRFLPPEYKATAQPRTVEDRNRALAVELGHLRAEVKRLESIIKFEDGVLLNEAQFLESVMRENADYSIAGLQRRISRLKGAIDREQGGLE